MLKPARLLHCAQILRRVHTVQPHNHPDPAFPNNMNVLNIQKVEFSILIMVHIFNTSSQGPLRMRINKGPRVKNLQTRLTLRAGSEPSQVLLILHTPRGPDASLRLSTAPQRGAPPGVAPDKHWESVPAPKTCTVLDSCQGHVLGHHQELRIGFAYISVFIVDKFPLAVLLRLVDSEPCVVILRVVEFPAVNLAVVCVVVREAVHGILRKGS